MTQAQLAGLLAPCTLVTVMLALGAGMPRDSDGVWRRHWPLILRLELATCLLVPLLGWLLLLTPPARSLSPEVRHAIALMAVCPSAPLILRKAGKQGGDAALAGWLQVGAALLAIITVPLLADLAERVFCVDGWDVRPRQVALQVGMIQLVPLLLGLSLRRLFPASISRLLGPLDRFANILLLLLVLAVLIRTAPLLVQFGAANLAGVLLMAVLVLLSLAVGFLLAGDGRERRITASLVTSMRNPGLALLLAARFAPELPTVKLGILVYVLVTVLVSIPVLRRSRTVGVMR
ncbi:MAG: bile acid:sodium symporter [Cyanobacteriota bacterium]|nr:bile acid:sodium symporter [Cyanobacteriota bacterium]